MQSIFMVLSVLCCFAHDIYGQGLQYFYSFPNERFAPAVSRQYQQLFYQQQQPIFHQVPEFYNQAPAVPAYQFKNPGAHVQPQPPSFYDSSFRIPGAHVQPPAPTFFYSEFQTPSQQSQYKMPGAHVQPTPPTFYQSPIRTSNTNDFYRGFSYHVNYDDGAKSSVVFFRGGMEYDINLPNRITVASDIVDPQQAQNISANVQRALDQLNPTILNKHHQFQSLQPVVEEILSQPFQETGIVHFYEGQHGLPASTSLLNLPSIQKDESILSGDTKDSSNDDDDTVSIDAVSSSRNAKGLDVAEGNETANGASSTEATTKPNESTTENSSSSSTTESEMSNTMVSSSDETTTSHSSSTSNSSINTENSDEQQSTSTSSEVPTTTTQGE